MHLRTILAVALLLRLAHALFTPAWQAPDEFPHYWVAQTFAHTGTLPAGSPDFPAYEAYQHPLYYLLLAGALAAGNAPPLLFDGSSPPLPMPLLAARLFSVLCGLITVAATWYSVRRLRPDRPDLPPIAAAFVALLPSFVGLSATVNNDALVVALASATLFFSLSPTGHLSHRQLLAAGFCAGGALASKLTGALVIFPVAWIFWHSFGRNRDACSRALFFLPGILLGLFLVIGRNYLTYGTIVALPPIAGEPAFSLSWLFHALRNLAGSFWIAFGRTYEVHPPLWIYLLSILPLVLLALIGWWRLRHGPFFRRDLLLVGGSLLLAVTASLFFTLRSPEGTQTSWGKNIYPILPLLAYAFATGWTEASPRFHPFIRILIPPLLAAGAIWPLLRPLL